jgi:hypothetical protein
MAIKQSIGFVIQLHGDGASTSITLTLATAAMAFSSPNGQGLVSGFDIASLVPTAVANLSCSDGTGVTGSIGVLGLTLTLNFSTALAANTDPYVNGTFIF